MQQIAATPTIPLAIESVARSRYAAGTVCVTPT
jgi:hypothetical protein